MSVEFEFDKNKAIDLVKLRLRDGLTNVGEFVAGEAVKNAPHDSSYLRQSITFEVDPGLKFVRISANTDYAAIQEFGGDIKPVHAKALAIPVHKESKNKSPREFDDLVFIPGKNGKAPILARVSPKRKKVTPMFVLVKRVRIPAHPYLRPAVFNNIDKIMELMAG